MASYPKPALLPPGSLGVLQAGRQPVRVLGVDGHVRCDRRARGHRLQGVVAGAPHHFRGGADQAAQLMCQGNVGKSCWGIE